MWQSPAEGRDAGAVRRPGAWLRLGGAAGPAPGAEEIERAARSCGAVVLEPRETEAAARLKAAEPTLTVLCRKRTFVVDERETGPARSTGLGWEQAAATGQWLAVDRAGRTIAWDDRPGLRQLRIWDPECRAAWTETVARELAGSPFDGVLVDDLDLGSHPLDLPLPDLGSESQLRDAHDALVAEAGEALAEAGRILVATVGDARRSPGRWRSLSEWGGVCEPRWLATASGRMLDPGAARQQAARIAPEAAEGVPADRLVLVHMPIAASLLRRPSIGQTEIDQLVLCGLAQFWILGGGRGLFSAGSGDGAQAHWIPEMQWDLGRPLGPPEGVVSVVSREFERGWAVVNLASDGRRRRHVAVPDGLVGPDGRQARGTVVLGAHQGLVLRRA